MKTFQVIFQTGRVQNILADRWHNERGVVHFEIGGKAAATYPAHELIMVDQLDEDGGHAPRPRHRQRRSAGTP